MNILFICPIHWTYLRQRPQQIALRLAKKGHRVLYLQFTKLDLFFFINIFGSPIYRLLPIHKVTDRLIILNIHHLLPISNERNFFPKIVMAFLEIYMRYLRFKPDAVVFYTPEHAFLLNLFKSMKIKIVYDCADEMSGFSHLSSDRKLLLQEKRLIRNSICIASSKVLYDKLLKINSNCYYIPNGVDFDHFFKAAKPNQDVLEVKNIKHPVIGYIGAIFDWFDAKTVCKLAELHPEYSILLVGPVGYGLEKFKHFSNIILLGTKRYEVLPEYLSCMDVCLIPFKINRLTLASNPIKLYEYLAAGKPVVSTALPEICEKASGLVYIAKDEEDFIRKVEEAVKEAESPNQELIVRRIKFAKENSWEKRINVIENLLRRG